MYRSECQQADWKIHKKSCEFQQVVYEANKKLALQPPTRPKPGRCTGCNLKFDGEDYYCEDACDECGYQACEICISHKSNGQFLQYHYSSIFFDE